MQQSEFWNRIGRINNIIYRKISENNSESLILLFKLKIPDLI
jgi:hypothetical protein